MKTFNITIETYYNFEGFHLTLPHIRMLCVTGDLCAGE